MSVIALEGMRFFAYHGVYEEEQILGGEYIVDVFVTTDTEVAAEEDNLHQTVNYETLYSICDFEMKNLPKRRENIESGALEEEGTPHRLIETVIHRIMLKIKATFQSLEDITVKVSKMNPPLGGRVERASIESTFEFTSKCGRCNRGMICYGDETCWCNEAKTLHPRTAEMIASEHGSCVCNNCINFYAG